MRHLVIYSHPNPASFNHAIMQTLAAELERRGQEVRVRDLYALKFDPVLKADELAGFQKGLYPPDVAAEQAHVRWADVLIFISPIWWGGLTAIARGYCDRVFSLGFAYAETEKGPQGLLTDKGGFLINTLGAPLDLYENIGMIKSMRQTTASVIFDFCGIRLLGQKFFGSVGVCAEEERREMLDGLRVIAADLCRL